MFCREEYLQSLVNTIKQFIVTEGELATIVDPVFKIKRNRVNAEYLKTIIRINDEPILARRIQNTLIKSQNFNGSWNEIHPNYDQQSALITAFIGEALLMGEDDELSNRAIERGRDFILSQEIEPGYFLKSSHYTADHLNVDASCGAFLAMYGKKFHDQECLNAARRVCERISNNQIRGYYPYTTNRGTYKYPLSIPCIHYQGVTMYYLIKIQMILDEPWIHESLMKAAEWLSKVQSPDGKFDWSKSGLMFAYHLSGAYAFAFASFFYAAMFDEKYHSPFLLCGEQLLNNTRNILLRWETDDKHSFHHSFISVLKTSKIGNFPLKERIFRFSYGMYREIARRRFSNQINSDTFHYLCKLLIMNPSTIEPFQNYEDMFMTSEVIDCLSYIEMMRKTA